MKEIILVCIRWYATYALSYCNLEEMMQERGVPNCNCKLRKCETSVRATLRPSLYLRSRTFDHLRPLAQLYL